MPSLNTGNAILSNAIAVDSSYNVSINGSIAIGAASASTFKAYIVGDVFGSTGFYTRNTADTFLGSSNNGSGIIVNGTTLVTKIVSGGNTVATFASTGAATFNTSASTAVSMISSSTASGLQLNNTGGTNSNWIIQSDGGAVAGQAALRFYSITASAYRMSIDGSGNVGIGTSSPIGKLMLYQSTAGNVLLNIVSNQGGSTQTGINFSPSMTDSEIASNPPQASIYATDSSYSANIIFANKATGAVGNALTERMRITSDGYLRLASKGIQFNGDTSDANSLDDYEEGTVNVSTLTDGSATFTQFTGNQTLSYTKIGNRVYVNGNIYNQSISGTWSNPLRIPLPFTAGSGDGRNRSYGAAALYNWGSTSDNIYLIEAGGTYATLVSAGSGGAWGTITTGSGFTAIVNFSYITS